MAMGKAFQRIADRSVVDGVVEVSGHGKDAADGSVDLLMERGVALRVVFAHRVAIDNIDFLVLSRTDSEVMDAA